MNPPPLKNGENTQECVSDKVLLSSGTRHTAQPPNPQDRGRTQASQDTFPRESRSHSRSPWRGSEKSETRTSPALCLDDLRSVASDIKNTLSAAISDLRADIQAIALRVEEVETTQARHDVSLCQVQQLTESHAMHLREINRHMEDLDNRGRCRNLRVRGIPESIDPSHLSQAVTNIFNDLLERLPDTPITFERIHRALRPRGKDTDPPRDAICCRTVFR